MAGCGGRLRELPPPFVIRDRRRDEDTASGRIVVTSLGGVRTAPLSSERRASPGLLDFAFWAARRSFRISCGEHEPLIFHLRLACETWAGRTNNRRLRCFIPHARKMGPSQAQFCRRGPIPTAQWRHQDHLPAGRGLAARLAGRPRPRWQAEQVWTGRRLIGIRLLFCWFGLGRIWVVRVALELRFAPST